MGNYIDETYISDRLGITIDESSSPSLTQITDAISKAEEDFEREFGIFREQVDVIETVDGGNSYIYVSSALPITSITQIEHNEGTLFDEDFKVVPVTDYKLYDGSLGKIALSNGFLGRQNYRITYDGGYSSADMPNNIKYMIYLMSMRSIFDTTLLNSQGQGNTTETIDVDVYKEVTKGGNYFVNGLRDIDVLIDNEKANFRGKLKTYLL